jgi:hypothetical protein
MFTIEPNTLYTRDDLAQMLAGTGGDVDTFIGRLATRKVFRMLWLGQDLLDAFQKATPLGRHDGEALAIPETHGGGAAATPLCCRLTCEML